MSTATAKTYRGTVANRVPSRRRSASAPMAFSYTATIREASTPEQEAKADQLLAWVQARALAQVQQIAPTKITEAACA